MFPSLQASCETRTKYIIPLRTPNKTVRIESLFYFYLLLMCEWTVMQPTNILFISCQSNRLCSSFYLYAGARAVVHDALVCNAISDAQQSLFKHLCSTGTKDWALAFLFNLDNLPFCVSQRIKRKCINFQLHTKASCTNTAENIRKPRHFP